LWYPTLLILRSRALPRLGPRVVLFLPRMLLHPYIHLARRKNENTSRGKFARPVKVQDAFEHDSDITLHRRPMIMPRLFYLPNPNALAMPITHLSTGATGNHSDQES